MLCFQKKTNGNRRRVLVPLSNLAVLAVAVLLAPQVAEAQVANYRVVRIVDAVVSNQDASLFANDVWRDSENSLAINPQNPNEIVMLGFAEDATGTQNAPLWHSLDSGRTWARQNSIPQPPGGFDIPNDQTLDWGRNNLLSLSFLTGDNNVISVVTSDPGNPSAFSFRTLSGVTQLTNNNAPGSIGGSDQPWVLVNRDPTIASQDNTYVAYDDFNDSDGVEGPDIRVAVSYGSNPHDFTVDRQVGNSTAFNYNPGVRLAKNRKTGAIFAIWGRCVSNCAGDPQNMDYFMNRSTDGGHSWSLGGQALGIAIANANSRQPRPKFGTVNALLGGAHHAAVDSTSGDVYYVYGNHDSVSNRDRMAIRRVTFNAGGTPSIGGEVLLTTADAALPQVAVDDAGTVGVFYYTFDGFGPAPANLPIFSAHLSLSTDHAATFTDRVLLTFQSPQSDSGDSRQRVLGDYMQLKTEGTCFYGTFTGDGQPFGRTVANTDPIYYQVCASLDTCVFASDKLTLLDRAQSTAATGAGSFADLGMDAHVTGTLSVDGNAMLRDRARVDGNVNLSGVLQHPDGLTITGTLREHASGVAFPGLPSKSFTVGTGTTVVAGGTTRTLAPGAYGAVTFRTGSTVTLSPGVFRMASLTIETDARVNGSGIVEVNVQGTITIGARAQVTGSAPSGLILYTNGTDFRTDPDARITGIVIGPASRVDLGARTRVSGCVGGREVTLELDSVVTSNGARLPLPSGSAPTCNDGVRNGAETDADCGGPACGACLNGQRCVANRDCQGRNCVSGSCQPAANVTATFVVTSDWNAGYCGNLHVMNGATQPATNWLVSLNTNQSTIYTSWNGYLVGASGPVTAAPSFTWNRVIAAGGTNDSVGFCANRTVAGSGVLPTIVSVSGTF